MSITALVMLIFLWLKIEILFYGIEPSSPEIYSFTLNCAKSQWKENYAIGALFILVFFLFRETVLENKKNLFIRKYLQKLNGVLISQSRNPLFYEGEIVEGAKTLTKEVAEVTQIDRVSLWLFNDDKDELICQQLYINSDDKWVTDIVIKETDHPKYFENIRRNPVMIIDDVEHDSIVSGFSDGYLRRLKISSMLVVPVIYAGENIGIISCGSFIKRHWEESEINFMHIIASLYAFAYSIKSGNDSEIEIKKKNTYLEHAAKIIRHDMHSGINTYIPRGITSLERRLSKKQITELKLESPIKLIKEGLKHTQKVYRGVYEFTNLVKKDSSLEVKTYNVKASLEDYLSSSVYRPQVIIEDLGELEINEPLFCTAIDNLIRNGLKYNDSPKKEIRIYRNEDTIFVEDNGRGMSSEEFKRLSKPYIRKEGQAEEGTGLGLNICIAILEEHGYFIECERLPIGTRIKINIKK
jgi:K+-sensing histidine kinase KdpD